DNLHACARYIERPLLIGGFKCDFRVYVLVVSVHPLKVYIYCDGLVRFGTSRYDLATLSDKFSHLTNSSINKLSPTLATDKHEIGPGCKWEFKQLEAHFRCNKVDDKFMWCKIINLVNATLIPTVPCNSGRQNYFELFGFDVVVDETMRPWLIEVNCSPALQVDCSVDEAVKRPLIEDLVDVVYHPDVNSPSY
ncbi:Tubulin--tyrosine ligase, putative, partial [Perkinsus marinus ATCC 50983]